MREETELQEGGVEGGRRKVGARKRDFTANNNNTGFNRNREAHQRECLMAWTTRSQRITRCGKLSAMACSTWWHMYALRVLTADYMQSDGRALCWSLSLTHAQGPGYLLHTLLHGVQVPIFHAPQQFVCHCIHLAQWLTKTVNFISRKYLYYITRI